MKKTQKGVKKARSTWRIRAMWFSVALGLYFLSIGPAMWLGVHAKNPRARDCIENTIAVAYWPLAQTARHCRPFECVLNAYIDIWS